MSFLLYNPLEAMVLILPLWILNKNKINWIDKKFLIKIFIKDCYVFGSLNLIVQIPLNFLFETLFYTLYNCIICPIGMFIILYFYSIKRFKNKNIIYSLFIIFGYFISMPIILSNSSLYFEFASNKNFINELLINLLTRTIQSVIISISFGGKFMFKKFLTKSAKENLKKTIAATAYGVGEPKLSKKLKAEVKNSK